MQIMWWKCIEKDINVKQVQM